MSEGRRRWWIRQSQMLLCFAPKNLHHYTGSQKDIINLRSQGFQVDDDNDPVEENISDTSIDAQVENEDWGSFFFHKMAKYCFDDHNFLRQQLSALEITLEISWRPNRVFDFLLTVTEVNVFLCLWIFFWTLNNQSHEYEDHTVFSFRDILAEALMENEILEKEKEVDDSIKRASKQMNKQ